MKKRTNFDRRTSDRQKILESVSYSKNNGAFQRGELINLGNGGARLVTNFDLEVGDRLTVLHRASSAVTIRSQVEVRWAKPLPGGLRQVIGVQELDSILLSA